MTTKTPTRVTNSTQASDFETTAILALLANTRRRYALYALSHQIGAMSLGELAEQIAIYEGDSAYDQYERIVTSLHHTHLPKLVEAGIVRYDAEQETVRVETVAPVKPYLELAIGDDLQ